MGLQALGLLLCSGDRAVRFVSPCPRPRGKLNKAAVSFNFNVRSELQLHSNLEPVELQYQVRRRNSSQF